jgi:hypothetical protein
MYSFGDKVHDNHLNYTVLMVLPNGSLLVAKDCNDVVWIQDEDVWGGWRESEE